jgi:CP family cyanate transporter-like MFS transporter
MQLRLFLSLVIVWLAGTALRLTILAVPPVMPAIHRDLGLSATGVGILGGLPVVLFACAAIPGSLLIARFGPASALIGGLLLTAIGGALRGVLPNAGWLYAMTIVTGAGVAIMQPTMAALVRAWLPKRVGFATALYSNGLLVGEIIPVMLMIPVVLPLVGGSWQIGLAVWSAPVILVALLVLVAAPRDEVKLAAKPHWWPDWRDPLIWRLGVIFGSVNSVYFATNTFLPDYLVKHGRPDLISAGLTTLNLSQLLASFLLLATAARLQGRVLPYLAFGLGNLAGVLICAGTASDWILLGAGLIGFSCAGVLVLALALPPLLCAPEDVARTSAAMFTTSYAIAMVVAVVAGACWDLSGTSRAVFFPLILCALGPIVLSGGIPFERAARFGTA